MLTLSVFSLVRLDCEEEEEEEVEEEVATVFVTDTEIIREEINIELAWTARLIDRSRASIKYNFPQPIVKTKIHVMI